MSDLWEGVGGVVEDDRQDAVEQERHVDRTRCRTIGILRDCYRVRVISVRDILEAAPLRTNAKIERRQQLLDDGEHGSLLRHRERHPGSRQVIRHNLCADKSLARTRVCVSAVPACGNLICEHERKSVFNLVTEWTVSATAGAAANAQRSITITESSG